MFQILQIVDNEEVAIEGIIEAACFEEYVS